MVNQTVEVKYKEQRVGVVSFDPTSGSSSFEYDPKFVAMGIEISPLHMPLREKQVYQFPHLDYPTYKSLPGLLADSLPDDFGNAVLNAWVARQGRSSSQITPLERLQYIGRRGMGALEFTPATRLKSLNASHDVAIAELVAIAQEVLNERQALEVALEGKGAENQDAMRALLSVGTSAGGARPKAVLAFNQDFSVARSGQAKVPDGFTHYLIKFDGVSEHLKESQTFGDPLGSGAMEYVYYQMAQKAKIDMMPCKLLNEGRRRHFITQRFDRNGNEKIHVQTLNGLAHFSYKQHGQYSYEELFLVLKEIGVGADDAMQLLRRMVFNIVARNHDDHSKNFSFILDPNDHEWTLAPAYDLAYSYKPGSKWIDTHFLSLNGKRDGFERSDFYVLEQLSPIFTKSIIDEVLDLTLDVLSQWPVMARAEDVPTDLIETITQNLRMKI